MSLHPPKYMVGWSELDVGIGVGRSSAVCASAWTASRRVGIGSILVETRKKEREETMASTSRLLFAHGVEFES
jgi:hypothetical protein